MRVVVVSSPGQGSVAHWSDAFADALAGELQGGGVQVRRLYPTGGRQRSRRVSAVAANHHDIRLEGELARVLREWPGAAVVHVGLGARGSPNLLWLAERLGSRAIACLDSAEVVCCRGDLVDHTGAACARFDDPARCRRCCSASFWRRPHAGDVLNRTDLLLGSLLVAEVVFVRAAVGRERLGALGVPAARVVVEFTPELVAERCRSPVAASGA